MKFRPIDVVITAGLFLAGGLFILNDRNAPSLRTSAEVLTVQRVKPARGNFRCEVVVAYDAQSAVRQYASRQARPAEDYIQPNWTQDRVRRRGDMRRYVRDPSLKTADFLRIATIEYHDASCGALRRGDQLTAEITAKPPFKIELPRNQ